MRPKQGKPGAPALNAYRAGRGNCESRPGGGRPLQRTTPDVANAAANEDPGAHRGNLIEEQEVGSTVLLLIATACTELHCS